MRTDYTSLIKDAIAKHGLPDADLLEAQVLQESGGRADAFRYESAFWDRYLAHDPLYNTMVRRRASSSYGLLQVMYPTARELGFTGPPEMLFIPEVGLDYGAAQMRRLLDWAEGDYIRALCAYNGGKGAALALPYRTQAYADGVLRRKLDLE